MEVKIEILLRRIAELEFQLSKALDRIKELEKENAELKSRLGMNSSNSSFPPSSDKFIKKKIKIGR